jgi:alpha-L-arabinofuranosidase
VNVLDVTAKTDEMGKVLQLQVVNLDSKPIKAAIKVSGFDPVKPVGKVIELTGKLDDVNTVREPRRIAPKEDEWQHGFKGGTASYSLPPHSFTILRIE